MAREMLRCLTELRVLELRSFSGAEEGCSHVIDIISQLPALQVAALTTSTALNPCTQCIQTNVHKQL